MDFKQVFSAIEFNVRWQYDGQFLFLANKKITFWIKKNNGKFKKRLKPDTFRELGASDLIANIWRYNNEPVHQPACLACKTYCEYCIQALREMWEEEWGDFEFAVGKFKTCDKSLLGTGQFQSENMHLIIDFLKKHN